MLRMRFQGFCLVSPSSFQRSVEVKNKYYTISFNSSVNNVCSLLEIRSSHQHRSTSIEISAKARKLSENIGADFALNLVQKVQLQKLKDPGLGLGRQKKGLRCCLEVGGERQNRSVGIYPLGSIRHKYLSDEYNNLMCHSSCLTCTDITFNTCLTCPTGATLASGACFCETAWDSTCTFISTVKPIFQTFDSFYLCLFPLVMLLFTLKVKTPLSYRVVSGLQSFSMLISSDQLYLYYESFFGLRTIYRSNGFYMFGFNRLNTSSIYFAMPVLILFCAFVIGMFVMYSGYKSFVKSYQQMGEYLKENWYHYATCFYFFSARAMLYYIGIWLKTYSTSAIDIITFSLFSLAIGGIAFKTIIQFHQQQLEEDVYPQQIYLYSILSPISIIGLPLVSSTIFYYIIFLAPIGLLFLLILFNRNYEICSKIKACFYVVQVLMCTFPIVFVLVKEEIKSIIVLIAIGISILIIVVELIYVYHSGINLASSSKVHPQLQQRTMNSEQNKSNDQIKSNTKGKPSKKPSKKATYF